MVKTLQREFGGSKKTGYFNIWIIAGYEKKVLLVIHSAYCLMTFIVGVIVLLVFPFVF